MKPGKSMISVVPKLLINELTDSHVILSESNETDSKPEMGAGSRHLTPTGTLPPCSTSMNMSLVSLFS